MAWTLQITHIDVVTPGDATLIVARNPTSNIVRSLLIDGGRANQANSIDQYLQNQGIAALSVMVVSHYDEDHFNGIQALLNRNSTRYDDTVIFDPGEPATLDVKGTRKRDKAGKVIQGYRITPFGREDAYQRYMSAIASRGNRQRITEQVTQYHFDEADPQSVAETGFVANDWHTCDWLLNRELLWEGVDPIPDGAPTVTCVAVNQWMLTNDDGSRQNAASPGLNSDRSKNQKSIAVKVTFNNFKYYAGGDLETTQEAVLQNYLNPTNNNAGRVTAMKTSHHGSDLSTSDAFLSRLRPRLAFISCGTANDYPHPTQRVVNSLEACTSMAGYYLTGEDLRTTTSKGIATPVLGESAEVAGVWPPKLAMIQEGDLMLEILEAGSEDSPINLSVTYQQPNAGTNRDKDATFHYKPYQRITSDFYANVG